MFFSFACEYSWEAAAHFHKTSMHALHTGDATVTSLAQPIAPAASTMKNFPEKFGTCPAHPKADHTAIECALRKADPSAFEAKVNGVVAGEGGSG